MKTAIFSYSDQGCRLSNRIAELFTDCTCYAAQRFAETYQLVGVESTCRKVQEVFSQVDLLVFVGACGIAVRAIAPQVKNKLVDPAVLVVDDCGKNVISLLSGHIGGANDYTLLVAHHIGAIPIITTATDINNKFAVDSFAVKNDLTISSIKSAMNVAARILTNQISLSLEQGVTFTGKIPPSLVLDSGNTDLGIYIGCQKSKLYANTLCLIPQMVHVGIGCKKGTPLCSIEELLLATLHEYNIDVRAIKAFASIDLKQEEQGLLQLADKFRVPISFYTAQQLAKLSGTYTPSPFVAGITGVDNVCERSAMQSVIDNIGEYGHFIVRKTSRNGVTIAMAVQHCVVNFQ